MPARVLAVFLALVLLWSGLTTHELSVSATGHEHAHVVPPASADDGSVDDHHLDDQPVQSQAETPSDLQALLMQHVDSRGPEVAAAGSWPWSTDALPAPFLDGLQRPPQAVQVTA